MATPSEKLAASLEVLHEMQRRGAVAIRASELKRTHRERLVANGFLQQVMKGWYIPSKPEEPAGESTRWYASYWRFCSAYLNERFGTDWCLSPEQSLLLHAGNWMVPTQLLVRSPKARNRITDLPHNTSLLDVRSSMPELGEVEQKDGLRIFSLPAALVACSAHFFCQNPTDARAALAMINDASDILGRLLEGGHSKIAGRLAGAFRNTGQDRIADDILKTMRTAGYDVRKEDPFETRAPVIVLGRNTSPYVHRLRLMWQEMGRAIPNHFPESPTKPKDVEDYLQRVEDVYATDAYHSLSIEGYQVSPELIERVRGGDWNPETNESDREHRNTLAARGYWQAYQSVRDSVRHVLEGKNPGTVAHENHGDWYREMFAPSVAAGLLRPADLAGYRNLPVFIRGSKHVPPNREAVRDLMPAYFQLLKEEVEPSTRVVLGHFMFVYIHPYADGNGRIGRFLMNVMLASAGYPWTVVPLERRSSYMAALEKASVGQDIIPFTKFLADITTEGLRGRPTTTVQ